MEASTTTRLSDIVAALEAYVRHVRELGLKQTALLLEMAKLDLQMRIHDITDIELDALCKAIERQEDHASEPAYSSLPPDMNATAGTVVSLFGGDRFSANGRAASGKAMGQNSSRGERLARGKTLIPR